MKHAILRRPEAILRANNFMGEREKLEDLVFRQSRITCNITFAQGDVVIDPVGAPANRYSDFVVARKILHEAGYPNAKQKIKI